MRQRLFTYCFQLSSLRLGRVLHRNLKTTTNLKMTTMSVTFLGTSSGGGPSESRNCSSLVCDLFGNGTLWMVDCAEGTYRQFALQPRQMHSNVTDIRPSKVTKIFVTHMHADHVMGIVPFLRGVLFPPPAIPSNEVTLNAGKPPSIEIYGPAGIRTFVRQIMKMTLTKTAETYTVNELLSTGDSLTPCLAATGSPSDKLNSDILHLNEIPGRDFSCDSDGLWRSIVSSTGSFGEVIVDAGPIAHRDPAIGFVFREAAGSRRKLVILGDTYDPSAITPLCITPAPALLIHEATDCHIPNHVDYNHKRTPATVLEKTLARGHSIPTMAGKFAKTIGAERLVLNHIGARFPASRHPRDHRSAVMREIEKQATEAWGSGRSATAAYDFLRIEIAVNSGDQQQQRHPRRHWQEGPHAHTARRNHPHHTEVRQQYQGQPRNLRTGANAHSSDDENHRSSAHSHDADPNEGSILIHATTRPNNKRRKNRH